MRAHRAAALLAASFLPGSVQAQSAEGLALEVRVGAGFESDALGFTTGAPEGYFGFGEVAAAPSIGIGLLLPPISSGIRPRALVSYAPPADVKGNWFPCEPGTDCPSVLLPVDGRASRVEATVGAELPLAVMAGPARPYINVGLGLRRYGFSWRPIGEPDDVLRLESGSFGETDFLARIGVGVGVELGRFDATLEGSADLSAFGPGRVPVPVGTLALFAEPTIDLGRETRREYNLTVGVRRYLD
jgi:hypothetical protein